MHAPDIEPLVERSKHKEILHQQLDCEKASDELDWGPTYTFDHGLAETVEWYTEFLRSSGSDRDGPGGGTANLAG